MQDKLPAHLGIVEWFRPGEEARVEAMITGLRRLGIRHLRTGLSWADYHAPGGQDWYDWLLPRLAENFELLPCVTYTPPSLGEKAAANAPPRRLRDYADFIDQVITRHGAHFDWLQLWNEPNNLNDWDWQADPGWLKFAEMAGAAAHWAQQRGKKVALAGLCPPDPAWLDAMARQGLLAKVDAISLHGFPGTWQAQWPGWPQVISDAQAVLDRHRLACEIWITETGYSTWRCDEAAQIEEFLRAAAAPAARCYWYGWQDLAPETASQEGFHFDERHYHLGLVRADGTPKLLCRLLPEGGIEKARSVLELQSPAVLSRRERPVLITGGAGFVGSNLANRLAAEGRSVLIYDNLSRPGVERNLAWLQQRHGEQVSAILADSRDGHSLRRAVAQSAQIFHFAAQVAVTTSVLDPVTDFDINLRGTLNLLEAIRAQPEPPPLVFASTNKVYGSLESVRLIENGKRYRAADPTIRRFGIDEGQALDLHSPYGCSKGGADQYVLDYARIYGLQACVFRMSCLYGPRQLGTEDQGWVAHFLISALSGRPITIFGDGKQVRDVLFVEDVVEAFRLAQEHMPRLSGQAFNIGGGPENAISLRDLLEMIARLTGRLPEAIFDDWRPGDQLFYVSDTRRFAEATGWRAKTSAAQGVALLAEWLRTQLAVAIQAAE